MPLRYAICSSSFNSNGLIIRFGPAKVNLFQIGCAGLAFQRFKAGTSAAFTEGLTDYDGQIPDGQYQSYPGRPDDGAYNEPPFGQQGSAEFDRF